MGVMKTKPPKGFGNIFRELYRAYRSSYGKKSLARLLGFLRPNLEAIPTRSKGKRALTPAEANNLCLCAYEYYMVILPYKSGGLLCFPMAAYTREEVVEVFGHLFSEYEYATMLVLTALADPAQKPKKAAERVVRRHYRNNEQLKQKLREFKKRFSNNPKIQKGIKRFLKKISKERKQS